MPPSVPPEYHGPKLKRRKAKKAKTQRSFCAGSAEDRGGRTSSRPASNVCPRMHVRRSHKRQSWSCGERDAGYATSSNSSIDDIHARAPVCETFAEPSRRSGSWIPGRQAVCGPGSVPLPPFGSRGPSWRSRDRGQTLHSSRGINTFESDRGRAPGHRHFSEGRVVQTYARGANTSLDTHVVRSETQRQRQMGPVAAPPEAKDIDPIPGCAL